MDYEEHKIENPFSPGAGAPPPALVGRSEILEKARLALARLQRRKSEKSFLLVGLRGVGKTVLLNKIDDIVEKYNCHSIYIEAHEKKHFSTNLAVHLQILLFKLQNKENSQKIKKAFRILKSFLKSLKLKYGDIEISLDLDIEPQKGSADSGDLEIDVPILLEHVGEAIKEHNTVLVLILDELQYLSKKELSALIMAFHRIVQKQLPLMMVGAGLPQLLSLVGASKSYAERMFDFPHLGPLEKELAFQALQKPTEALNVSFDKKALEEIFNKTKGYPYFLQEWGYQCWNLSNSKVITLDIVKKANKHSLNRLDEGFFRVRFDRLTPTEKKYLRALASFGGGSHRSGDIAKKLGASPQSVAPLRNKLIKKGMIYSPSHGDTEFTVPLFDNFMKRIMPE